LNDSDRRWIESEGLCPYCLAEAEDAYYTERQAEDEAAEREAAMEALTEAVREARGLECRTLASGSLALYEKATGKVVEIITEAFDGFDAFAHIAPTEEV